MAVNESVDVVISADSRQGSITNGNVPERLLL